MNVTGQNTIRMIKTKYLALLRGINVGGNNLIKMADLKACFESLGFERVATYIQSGNVLFTAEEKNLPLLVDTLEKKLSKTFNYHGRLVLITHEQLQQVVKEAPAQFGQNSEEYRYDVIFTKDPLTPKEALKSLPAKEGVDQVSSGEYAVYFSRLISKASQSHLSRVVKLPMYQNLTIRNWNTTSKLLLMMEAL
jgi:uncharacterized protein (DUF1697 family)